MLMSGYGAVAFFPKHSLKQAGTDNIRVFLFHGYVFPTLLFYFVIKFLYWTAYFSVDSSKASLKIYWFKIKLGYLKTECDDKYRLKDSGDLCSPTFCVCVNYVHIKPDTIKAILFLSFSVWEDCKKRAKFILRSHYFNLSWEPANIVIIHVFLFIEILLSERIKRIMKIKYFKTLLWDKEDLRFLFC